MANFNLVVELELSKPLPDKAKSELQILFDKANKELLKKPATKEKFSEASNIDKWVLKNDKLTLDISSGGLVKAHEGFLRLKKELAMILGKDFKTGIKKINVNKYDLEFEIDKKPAKQISLPFVKKTTIKGKTAFLELENIPEIGLEKDYATRIISRFNEKIRAQEVTGKAATVRTIRKSKQRLDKYAFKKDPTQEIIDKGWVREFPGAGVWTIMPPFAALIKAIQQLVIDKIAKPLKFDEVILPRLIPLEVQKRKGQLSGIPQEMFWVCPPAKRDPEFFEDYRDYVEITGQTAPDMLMKKLRSPLFSLAYAQCEPFYDMFHKEIIDIKKLPFKFYDANGPTWRWEGGGLKGLERLNEFLRMEFTYIGTKEQVLKIRDDVLKISEEIIDKIFDVEFKIDANIPVYLEHAGKTEEKESNVVKTYDLTVILPFKTASKEESELEISSYHVHEDFYMKRFHCKERNKNEVWTGCSGIGPSRWAFVFLTRFGLDYNKWPKEIKKYIKKLPKVPEMVSWPRGK